MYTVQFKPINIKEETIAWWWLGTSSKSIEACVDEWRKLSKTDQEDALYVFMFEEFDRLLVTTITKEK